MRSSVWDSQQEARKSLRAASFESTGPLSVIRTSVGTKSVRRAHTRVTSPAADPGNRPVGPVGKRMRVYITHIGFFIVLLTHRSSRELTYIMIVMPDI